MSTLVIISPIRGFIQPNGKIVLPKKFVDGMKLYSQLWGSKLLHICEPGHPGDGLDNIEVDADLPEFKTLSAPVTEALLRAELPRNSIVVPSGEKTSFISRTCNQLGIPSVYLTEFTFKTRLQIVAEYQRNRIHGLWGQARQVMQEVRQRNAMRLAAGVQCNGLPAYDACSKINSNCHLYFDTRTTKDMLATYEQVTRRANRPNKKLRLAFSGRLTLMKGVDDLLKVAEELKSLLGDNFVLSICGDGDYAQELRDTIARKGLGDVVTMLGTLDFKTELLPFIINETDVFVCCHRQGDPSCTYLETMSCGVPIIGYANEAWRSLHKLSGAGWIVSNKKPIEVAQRIAALTPECIEREAKKSLDFASDHTFEKTFIGRVDHLKKTLKQHCS